MLKRGKDKLFVFWDANIFLAYLNNEPQSHIIEDIWTEIRKNGKSRIITSALTEVEVYYLAEERGTLSTGAEAAINNVFNDSSILSVEVNRQIAQAGRSLIRFSFSQGWKLTTFDAVQLATASWVNQNQFPISEIQTLDGKLHKLSQHVGIDITLPSINQPSLNV